MGVVLQAANVFKKGAPITMQVNAVISILAINNSVTNPYLVFALIPSLRNALFKICGLEKWIPKTPQKSSTRRTSYTRRTSSVSSTSIIASIDSKQSNDSIDQKRKVSK